jgi:long-chain acyl-CoA synthetase
MEGGKKIQPDHIEDRFDGKPNIREIAVLQCDRKLVALVVPALAGAKDSKVEDAVASTLSSVSKELPSYLRITDFAMTRQPLPRTNLGKLKRHELAERYEAAKQSKGDKKGQAVQLSAEDRELLEEPLAKQTWEWLQQRFPANHLSLDQSPQLDLNVDSLEWMNLTLELRETTGVELTEDAISRVDTVRDLLNEVIESGEIHQR